MGRRKGKSENVAKIGRIESHKHWNDARDIMSVESCSPSMACDMEEAGSESSRKMQDEEETTSEASWRLEATVPWNGAEGVSVNPEGESRHGQVLAKMARKGRENQTRMEEKANGKAPSDKGAEVQSPRRKMIRVESEETQDYVPSGQHPIKGPCFGVTIAAVTKPSDSGSLLRLWSRMARRSAPSICVSSVTTKV